MKNSVDNPVYDFVGRLSIALYSQGMQISFDALKQILEDEDLKDYSDISNRGIARSVKAAYDAWQKVDPVVHHAIAFTFTNKEGNLAWQ